MRGAIAGFGAIAMGHMAGYSQITDLSIAAVVDICADRREYAEQRFGIPAYSDLSELAARQSLDFIDICTPPDTHAEYSTLGLACGWHVLCEKPVFPPGADGYERVMSAARSSGRIFYPCHVYKFAPIIGAMRKLTSEPGFGKVRGADFRILRRGHALGVPGWRPHWRRERPISGGGILRDHGPHCIYLAMNLTGQAPLSVSCLMGNLRKDQYQDTEDTVLLRMRCAGDVEITLTLSWACDYRSTSYCITGEAGSVRVEGNGLSSSVNGEVVTSQIESGFDDPAHKDWFRDMLLDFAAMAARPDRQAGLIREALTTAVTIDAAYESAAASGRWADIAVPGHLLPAGQ